MTPPIYREALVPLIDAFEALGIAYHIGGSVAGMSHGVARTTLDVDLVADLKPQHVAPLVERLQPHYYVDQEMIEDAVRNWSSFNVIHLPTMFKVDVFILKPSDYDRQAFMRAELRPLDDEPDAPLFFVESAEDVILNKLRWYQLGGGVSDRQWTDLLGVMRVQAGALDLQYLRRWAVELGLTDLLDRALVEAQAT
jgi:hypothetical protein